MYLIWSNEHRAWWAPHERGYTVSLVMAGRYTRIRALEICRQANHAIDFGEPPNEVPVLETDMLDAGARL